MKLHLPLSLRKSVLSYLLTAFSITNAAGAVEYLQNDSGLQGGNQTRETLTLVNGQQMTLNGNSVDSSLNLSDGTLSLDYGSATAPSSMQGNDLTLSGGTTLHLIPGTTTDGKYINLLTNVGTLCGADGSPLSFDNANNAASQYFDTSQPGSGYWKDATLQLTPDGTLQMQLHNETVKDALTITARQTDSVDYCYYESISFEDIIYSTSSYAYGGAIYGSGTIPLRANGSVTFSGNKASGGDYAYGGAIYGYVNSTITLSDNGSVTFSGNTASGGSYAYGGAIYRDGDIMLSNNGSVTFSGNTASGGYDASGGAIDVGYDSTITLSNNGSVTFSGNSASGTSTAHGGAIYGAYDSTITLSNNGSVTFSGNTSTSSDSYADGGAIEGATITLNNNSSVTFDGNTASGEGYAYGGAIYGHGINGSITLSANGSVTFSGNTASGTSTAFAGAIGGGTITLSANGSVTFDGNTAKATSSDSYADGGAIEGDTITLSNNGSVTFSGNTASGGYGANGGAIRAYGKLSIRNNDSVLFEKNAEISNGSYRLRSIYAEERGGVVSLSAAKGKSIEFRDSVYIASGSTVKFNEDYTDAAGAVHKQEGDIIFTGAYTEKHLNVLLLANEENRDATDEEIAASRTSEMHDAVALYGGRLRVEEKAVLKTSAGLTVAEGSNATVKVSNAELDAGESDITIGATGTLELSSGATVRAANINIAAGATFAVTGLTATELYAPVVAVMTLSDVATVSESVFNISEAVVVEGNLTFEAGSTLKADGAHFSMSEDSVLTFKAMTGEDKINLVLTLGAEYGEDGKVALFSDADVVKFILDGEELDSVSGIKANLFFTGDWVNENTTINYDSKAGTVFVKNVNSLPIPEPTTATLSLLALAALAARRRRK